MECKLRKSTSIHYLKKDGNISQMISLWNV